MAISFTPVTPFQIEEVSGVTVPQAIIDIAHSYLVTVDCLVGKSESELQSIEIYYSLHLFVMTNPSSNSDLKSERIDGDYQVTYNTTDLGEGINGTKFGQIANQLSGNCLQNASKTKSVIQSFDIYGCR